VIFYIYARTVHASKFTIKLCHDFTINSSRKSREITSISAAFDFIYFCVRQCILFNQLSAWNQLSAFSNSL